jgi:hypothetical protein
LNNKSSFSTTLAPDIHIQPKLARTWASLHINMVEHKQPVTTEA